MKNLMQEPKIHDVLNLPDISENLSLYRDKSVFKYTCFASHESFS